MRKTSFMFLVAVMMTFVACNKAPEPATEVPVQDSTVVAVDSTVTADSTIVVQ